MKTFTLLMVLPLLVGACAVSTQNFADRSYMSDGMIEREIIGKNRTVAPPFGAKALATHQLNMQESADFWDVQMGNTAELEGGDISGMIDIVEILLEKAALEPLVP